MKAGTLVTLAGLMAIAVFSCRPGPDEPEPPGGGNGVYAPTPYELQVPPFFPAPEIPADNPLTVEGVALGEKLFFDKSLSSDNTISCGSCHKPEEGFSDSRTFSEGVGGQKGTRQSMAIINLAWARDGFFWDGRAATLEDQVHDPITNPIEMNSDWDDVIAKLKEHPEYPEMFRKAFGTPGITRERVSKAIAQFERTLIVANTKYDKWRMGQYRMTDEEKEGMDMFFNERADCFHCHGNVLTTTHRFSNNGLDAAASIHDFPDPGLGGFTGRAEDYGLFKIPTLRNISKTAPYMHDGRFKTLEEVIEHYNSGGHPSPTLDVNMKNTGIGGLRLNEDEKAALLAFLRLLDEE